MSEKGYAFKSDDGFDVNMGDGIIVIDKERLCSDYYEVIKPISDRRNSTELPMHWVYFSKTEHAEKYILDNIKNVIYNYPDAEMQFEILFQFTEVKFLAVLYGSHIIDSKEFWEMRSKLMTLHSDYMSKIKC